MMKFEVVVLTLLLIISLSGIAGATAGSALSISPPAVTLTPGSSVTYNFRINELPAGLAGYSMQVKLTNPTAGQITTVSFPDWATVSKSSSLPSDNVTVSAVDLGKQVEEGASGVSLVSITVTARNAGTSTVRIQNITMEDDQGGMINPDLATAQLKTLPGGGSETGSDSGGSPVTPVVSAMTAPVVNQSLNQSTYQSLVATATTALPVATVPEVTPVKTIPVITTAIPSPVGDTQGNVPLYQRIPRLALYGFGLIVIIVAVVLLYLGITKKI